MVLSNLNLTHVQVNYFPSRFDPVRHAERFPENRMPISGPRERRMIEKENNFQQPGDRFRGWDAARQDRFVTRLVEFLAESRCTQVWGCLLGGGLCHAACPACLQFALPARHGLGGALDLGGRYGL